MTFNRADSDRALWFTSKRHFSKLCKSWPKWEKTQKLDFWPKVRIWQKVVLYFNIRFLRPLIQIFVISVADWYSWLVFKVGFWKKVFQKFRRRVRGSKSSKSFQGKWLCQVCSSCRTCYSSVVISRKYRGPKSGLIPPSPLVTNCFWKTSHTG